MINIKQKPFNVLGRMVRLLSWSFGHVEYTFITFILRPGVVVPASQIELFWNQTIVYKLFVLDKSTREIELLK